MKMAAISIAPSSNGMVALSEPITSYSCSFPASMNSSATEFMQ
jgi:hypothetical protein